MNENENSRKVYEEYLKSINKDLNWLKIFGILLVETNWHCLVKI